MRRWERQILLVVLLVVTVISAGCNGGDGSGGGSNNDGVQVFITSGATSVPLNGVAQFTAAVTGAMGISIASTNGAARVSNIVTITTQEAHGFAAGQTVTITGVSDASFNGTFAILSVPSSTTFTYTQNGADATSGGGTVSNNSVKWFVNDMEGGDATVGTITTGGQYTAPGALPPPVTAMIASGGAVRAANVVTITTTADHDFAVGQVVRISGVTDTSFNGTFAVASVPSTTTFTYSQVLNDAMSGGGMVSSFAVKIKAVSVADSSASATSVLSLTSGITVRVTPSSAVIGTDETFQFVSTVIGSSNPGVTWSVNGIDGGDSTVGTITVNGLYTAPASPPNSSMATITASGAVRTSNVVTITTASAHGFTAGRNVTIAGVSDASFNGTFPIATVPSTATFTYSQTGPDATSGGGTATSASSSVTIKATSVVDTSRSATALATVETAVDPTLASISPTKAPQGAVFQDVFLTGSGFLSTSTVRVNGTALAPSAISQFSPTLIRARVPASLLAASGMLAIDVQRQNGATSAPQNLNVVPVRPALIAASPDSATESGGGGTLSFNVNGGYYGAASAPAINAEFSGNPVSATVDPANEGRRAELTINQMNLTPAGLYQVAVRNETDPTLFAATNLAVQPSGTPAVLAPPIPVGMQPSAIAINMATGIALVANRCSDSLTQIDVGTLTPVGTDIPVGTYPTGVAVDEVRNLALVANSGDNTGCSGPAGMPSVSIVDLAAGAVSSTISNVSGSPVSVGVNPLTGLALVVYQSTNHADILDLTQTPPAIVSTTTISTGANPRVAVDPRLNWAVVTPGGAGTLSIVDLSRRLTATIASQNGASRGGGITTITTDSAHAFQVNQVVRISGVADLSFNGAFTITAVPSSTTFSYVQTGLPDGSSGGGTVVTTRPLATVTIGSGVRGIGINTFTQRALLADPGSTGLTIINLFDQAVSSFSLNEIGATAAAFNPFTDIAVTVNPNTNQASVIDPRTPARLATVPVGAGPRAVAIDPGTNTALVVNETDGNVTPIGLGSLRPLHIAALSMPLSRQFAPGITLSSTLDLPLTIFGKGFVGGSVVRLDGVALGPPSSVTDRRLVVNVPAPMLAGPRRFVVDVLNPTNELSNVLEFTVVQPVDLLGAGGSSCATPAPTAVTIDAERDQAVVTNSGCDDVSFVDLTSGAIAATVAVGDNPRGVALSSRLGRAIVTNSGSNGASILDLTVSPPTVTTTVTVGTEPLGVAIDEGTHRAIVANAGSNTLTVFDAIDGGADSTVTVNTRPVAVAVDADRELAVVAQAASNNLSIVSLSSLSVQNLVGGVQLPTAVVFDPVTGLFVANSSLTNSILLLNPDTRQSFSVRTGINPTSVAYNPNSSTLVTVNTASSTLSVMDFLERRIRAVLPLTASAQFAIAIHPRTNLAVIADEANNRVLLLPLPH